MSEQKRSFDPGRFCWNELVTRDEEGAWDFYHALFGWTTEAFTGGTEKYTLWKKDGDATGGMVKCDQPDMPSHWLPYVAVEDVDAIAEKTRALGGKVVVEPFDVPTVGRMAVLIDPQGAAIAVLRPMD